MCIRDRGSHWAADTKRTACALLGRLTDSNTGARTSTAALVAYHGGIELLVKTMKEASMEATFACRNAAYVLRNLARDARSRCHVFVSGAAVPLVTLLGCGMADGKAVAARALQKLSEDTQGMDKADHLRMKQAIGEILGVAKWNEPLKIMEELRRRARS
eukprot:TRINITY_DN20681_c0_g1_i1.p1 TRINITY_DN20681_c0_g1~~TRINITY_DN20681_c0_g1_i1.p1  ORF type:complete len:160 (+),score=40.95 TRINITY_DN20681_c0_g1_i1:116-595(+)